MLAVGLAMALPASPAAAAAPKVTITAGPTVNADNSVSLTYSINRQSKSIASRVCSVDSATSSIRVGCGSLPATKTNPTVVNVTVSGLADGTYTFRVRFTLTGGGGAARTSAPFTIETPPVVDQDNGFPVGNTSNPQCFSNGTTFANAQTFTAGRTGSLVQVTLWVYRALGSGPLLVDIHATSGGLPTGPSLSTTTYTGNGSRTGFDLPLSQPVSLTQGTEYAIVWGPPCDNTDPSRWFSIGATAYAGGQALSNPSGGGTPWTPLSAIPDFAFKTWMTD